MFQADVYRQRREQLCTIMESGILLFIGHDSMPVNAPGNMFPFRQDSSFLYYFGQAIPGLVGIVDIESGAHLLFGQLPDPEEFIWSGSQPSLERLAHEVGADKGLDVTSLKGYLDDLRHKGVPIHFLPPYRPDTRILLAQLIDSPVQSVDGKFSDELTRAVIAQRSIKTSQEIAEIIAALDISSAMYAKVFEHACSGRTEQEIKGLLEGEVLVRGSKTSFASIVTTHGNILHNQDANHRLEKGDLLLIDSGAESPMGYASDITRTFPVSGRFSSLQQEIYAIVLEAQKRAVETLAPGVLFRHAHDVAARAIVEGFKDMGVMQGDTDEAVQAGAYALFFVHGLGHMLGLDVHDMESLGEDLVGYGDTITRSSMFGLRSLRLARKVESGFVVTVEPGVYVIPDLIEKWRNENRCADFIRYDKLDSLRGFTGIRIEDDVLVGETGARILSKSIPKEIGELEQLLG